MDEHFNGTPLLSQNTVDIDTIQSQRFYCEKYDASGHWIIKDDKVATVFSYRDQQLAHMLFAPTYFKSPQAQTCGDFLYPYSSGSI